MSTWSKNDVAVLPQGVPDDIADQADRMRDAQFHSQQFGISPQEAFDLQPQLNQIAFGKRKLAAAPGRMLSDAFQQAMADKPAAMLHGLTVYTPGKVLGVDALLDKASLYLQSLKDPTVTKRVQTAEQGRLWPVGEERRWWQVEAKYLPEVINAWAANVGDQIPLMLLTQAGRMAGRAIGAPLSLVAGAGAAAATGGPDPTDVVTAPAVVGITQEVVKHLGGAAPVIATEAAGFLDRAAGEFQADPDLAEKYARLYGVGSGAIEYAQNLWLLGRYSKITQPVRDTILKTVLKHIGGSAVEGLEEMSQTGLENFLMGKLVAEMKARHPEYDKTAPALTEGIKRSGILGAGVAALTGLPGTGMTVAQAAEARRVRLKPETKKFNGEPSVQEVQRAQEQAAARKEDQGEQPKPLPPVAPAEPPAGAGAIAGTTRPTPPAAGAKPNVQRTRADLGAITDEQLVQEALSLPKTHAVGVGMGQNEFAGTFVSTEQAGNRYADVAQGVENVTADIKNPKIFRSATEYGAFHEQFLPEGFNPDEMMGDLRNPADQIWAESARKATEALQAQGYDSVYLPESENNEGILVVFDKGKVQPAAGAKEGGREAEAETPIVPTPEAVRDIVQVPTQSIKADPERFQYKLDATGPGGVTEKLAEVEKWNPKAAGVVLVWEDKSGQRYVVDGHHRLALAKKLGVDNINTYIVREADGISAQAARVLGAMSNLADEKGTAIDAAKLFRDSNMSLEDLKREGVDIKSQIVKQGLAMKALSDEVFRMVIDGKIPANMAAKIGENVENPVQQKQVADMIANGEVSNAREAELLARTINSAPVLSKSEQTLFGTETTEKSLYAERAKVLSNVENVLKTNKKVFGVLSSKTGIIEAKGNVLAKDANIAAKERADEILYLLETLVNSKGPVSEALNEATKQYAENPTKQRLAEVTTELLAKWESELTVESVGKVHSGVPESGDQGVGLFGGTAAPIGGPSGGLAWHTAIREAMHKSKEIRPEVEWEIHQETSRRAGSYMNRLQYLREEKGLGSEEALQRAKATLKGEKTEWQRFESLDNVIPNPKEVRQAAFDDIATTDRLMVYERINAADAFTRLWDGYVIAPYEAKILKKWRPELADLIETRIKQQPITVQIFSKLEDALGLLKFGAAFDVQMRRQARWLMGRHPQLYAQSVVKDVEAYIFAARADKIAKEVEIDPQHKSAVEHGVVFLERGGTGMGKRPEQYISHWGEKIPILGKVYAASMRGFVEGFNWLQQQLWDYKIAAWKREGKKITPEMLDNLAEFNNTFLGMMPAKTDFGRAARRVLAPVMWSPTLTWSRIRSPEMILTNPTMRAETAATLGSYIGTGIMLLAATSFVARLLGRDDPVEWDVGSTDFGKVRIGNTRFDVFGDGGTYIRAFLQTVAQKKTNAAGRVRRDVGIDALKQMLRNKRAPFIDLVAQVWTGRNYYGGDAWALPDWAELKEKGGVQEIVAKAGEKITEPTVGKVGYFVGRDLLAGPFLAFFVQGALEAGWNDGWPVGLMAAADEFFSGSTLSYEPSANAKAQMLQDQAAVATHGKLWEDLAPSEQERLRRKVPEIGELEEKASFERLPPEEVKMAETNASAQRLAKALPPAVKQELDAAHIRISGLSRAWGDFRLNDKRYEEYNDLTSDILTQRLQRLIAGPTWARTRADYKDKRLRATIKAAKDEARAKLRQQIERDKL